MTSFTAFLVVYLFGGLTFIPLVIALGIYLTTRPVVSEPAPEPSPDALTPTEKQPATVIPKDAHGYDGLVLPGDDLKTLDMVRRTHARDKAAKAAKSNKSHKHRSDRADGFATAGYFAVHRKYVSIGVDSRPIEPGSVGPAPVAPPSPSVYQTFFRNMLNKKNGTDTVEVSNAASPRPKNARNMFYVVLRHGHLILFDDDQQVDVRHVIKLADHDVSISSGGSSTPEGELFIKRNAIHLSPRNLERAKAHNAPAPQPWFFFCENCSEKEDFYFSLIQSQEDAPQPHNIEVLHLTSLMERLHASEEAAEMRWLNALIGRLFLGVYKTTDVLNFVQKKVVTKLSRMPRPSFVASLVVQRVDIGETTPQITSPRLKSLTAEGECIVEADVRYSGRFEIDVAAVLRVSTPIGQQEVKTSLAIMLTQLEGHILFKIKAPPSNRVWFSFRHMPKIEMEVRPIIMARQLTWPVFIQMIEGKIKEAIAESIVLPFWDDTPFFSTEKKAYRGGLWEDESDAAHDGTAIRIDAVANGTAPTDAPDGQDNASPAVLRLRRLSKAASSPAAPTLATTSDMATSLPDNANARGRTSSFMKTSRKNRSPSEISQPHAIGEGNEPPATLTAKSTMLSATSDPSSDAAHLPPSPLKNSQSGSNVMSWLSSGTLRSRASSPLRTEVGTSTGHDVDTTPRKDKDERPKSSRDNDNADPFLSPDNADLHDPLAGDSPASQATRAATIAVSTPGSSPSLQRKRSMERAATVAAAPDGDHNAKTGAVLAAAMTGAAQSAKRWGINALQRRATAVAERKAKAELEHRRGSAVLDLTKPMGGGLPLPPLGEPLPLPSEIAPLTEAGSPAPGVKIKRKQVQSQGRPDAGRRLSSASSSGLTMPALSESAGRRQSCASSSGMTLPALSESTGRRRQNTGSSSGRGSVSHLEPVQDIFVIEAPIDSEPEEDDGEGEGPLRVAKSGASSHSVKSGASGHESSGADGRADRDEEEWGELAESVMSAFMKEDGQAADGGQQPQEESLLSFDTGVGAAPVSPKH